MRTRAAYVRQEETPFPVSLAFKDFSNKMVLAVKTSLRFLAARKFVKISKWLETFAYRPQ